MILRLYREFHGDVRVFFPHYEHEGSRFLRISYLVLTGLLDSPEVPILIRLSFILKVPITGLWRIDFSGKG